MEPPEEDATGLTDAGVDPDVVFRIKTCPSLDHDLMPVWTRRDDGRARHSPWVDCAEDFRRRCHQILIRDREARSLLRKLPSPGSTALSLEAEYEQDWTNPEKLTALPLIDDYSMSVLKRVPFSLPPDIKIVYLPRYQIPPTPHGYQYTIPDDYGIVQAQPYRTVGLSPGIPAPPGNPYFGGSVEGPRMEEGEDGYGVSSAATAQLLSLLMEQFEGGFASAADLSLEVLTDPRSKLGVSSYPANSFGKLLPASSAFPPGELLLPIPTHHHQVHRR